MATKYPNYAFIDGNNLYLGIRSLGWKLDYNRFRVFLHDRFAVEQAFIFLGYIPTNQGLYTALQRWGYTVSLKPTVPRADGKVKGNCDVDLTLQAMIEFPNYDQAVVVSADGDFLSLIQYLHSHEKLARVIAPDPKSCSSLLKKSLPSSLLLFLDQHRHKLDLRSR